MTCSEHFNIQSESSISQLCNTVGRYNLVYYTKNFMQGQGPVNSPPTIDQSIVLQLFTGMTTATETRPDIAISSRITDFNVQISAVNIHSHCTQMFGQTISLI